MYEQKNRYGRLFDNLPFCRNICAAYVALMNDIRTEHFTYLSKETWQKEAKT